MQLSRAQSVVKSVQRGTGLILTGIGYVDISIAPVDMEKSSLSFSVYPEAPNDASGDHLGAAIANGVLLNGSTVKIARSASGRATYVSWQVVEYV